MERENELRGSGGKTYSLWKPQRNGIGITWINLVTQREISTEPKECKGTLLADDVRSFDSSEAFFSPYTNTQLPYRWAWGRQLLVSL